MIEASATRSPAMPWTRNLSSTTAMRVMPHLAGSRRMPDGAGVAAHKVGESVSAVSSRRWMDLPCPVRGEGSCAADLDRFPQPGDGQVEVASSDK